MMLDFKTAEALSGDRFTVRPEGADAPVVLTLKSVTSLGGDSPREGGPFSMLFEAGPGPGLPQQIYRLEPESGAAMDIFLVPLGPGETGMRYEAVFS